jgi:hypothetical protein
LEEIPLDGVFVSTQGEPSDPVGSLIGVQGQTYTASRLAADLGISRQAVQGYLAGCPPSDEGRVNGQPTRLWRFKDLPKKLQARLEEAARQCGYRNAEHLLAAPEPQWQPATAAGDCSESRRERAYKLRTALARMIELRNDMRLSRREWTEMGTRDYAAAFGHKISERHLLNLLDRTLKRAGPKEDFSPLDLYLDERAARKRAAPLSVPPLVEAVVKELAALISGARETEAECELVWRRLVKLYDERFNGPKSSRKTKTALLRALVARFPFLGRNANALRMTLARKYQHCLSRGWDPNATKDGRKRRKQPQSPVLPEADKKLLTATGAKLGGGCDQAWRDHYPDLSDQTRKSFPGTSRMPERIRRVIAPDVKLEKVSLKGPNAVKSDGAYVNRDPNGIRAGEWDQSDDMTMVNMWWDDMATEPGGFWFGQGQLLVWLDERSWFAYGCDLISDPYYDAFSVRNSWTVKAMNWGLPNEGLSLEGGLWKTSKLLRGDWRRVRDGSEVPLAETALGLEGLGLRFHNATHARVKVIERFYGLYQNDLQALPGYVGRNPITDRYEAVQQQIRLVKAGKAHPSEFFLDKRQMMDALLNLLLKQNKTPHYGKYHDGRTPEQVFQECASSKHVLAPEILRHLVATNRYVIPVGGNGIAFRFGRRTFRYKGYELGKRRGYKVVAYFNCEDRETICCTDQDGQNPFTAELEPRVYNHDPLPGTLEKALAQNAAQNRYQKELHQSLKPYYNSDFFKDRFRPCVVDGETVAKAQEFARQKAELKSRQKDTEQLQRRGQNVFGRLGLVAPPNVRQEQLEAGRQLDQFLKGPET